MSSLFFLSILRPFSPSRHFSKGSFFLLGPHYLAYRFLLFLIWILADFDSVSLIGFNFLNWCWHQSFPVIILKIFSGDFMTFNFDFYLFFV